MKPAEMAVPEFRSLCAKADTQMFTWIQGYEGSVSAEHGIGLLKRHLLKYTRTEAELAIMQDFKRSLDPKNLLKPRENFMNTLLAAVLMFSSFNVATLSARAETELKVGDAAPTFKLKDQDGKDFDLASRKGKWTVLYFYPKAGTPGCTKQACGFRDDIKKIEVLGANVYGISTDTVADQAKFHKEHNLNFTLLADPEAVAVGEYGSKMPAVNMSKRWTYIIGPKLEIREIEKDVDPALDASKVAKKIAELQKK